MPNPSLDIPSLRGRCRELAEAACADDPTLTLVSGHHSRCAGEPTFALMCPCHWCKRWADTHGPFSVPEDTKPIEETDRG